MTKYAHALRCFFCRAYAVSQGTASPDRPWHSQWEEQLARVGKFPDGPEFSINPSTNYSLGELIDLAETHNPKLVLRGNARAPRLLHWGWPEANYILPWLRLPFRNSVAGNAFFGANFYRQTIEELEGRLELNYTVFDFGARRGRISTANAESCCNSRFQRCSSPCIYQVEQAYINR